MRGLLRRALLAAALALPACATHRYDVSAIGAVAQGAGGADGPAARLQLEGVEVEIDALDANAGEAPPLSLRVRFRARELGYSFDPTQVRLRKGGEEWHARRLDGPACEPSGVLAETDRGRLWLAPRSCVALAFDAAVESAGDQELVIDGLARGRQPLAPVAMPIARRHVVARALKPGVKKAAETAIKVPLYILLLPLAAY